MNWLNTNAARAQWQRLPLIGCLILAYVVPVILCQTQDKPLRNEHTNAIGSDDTYLKENKILWTKYYKDPHYVGEPAFKTKSDIVQRRHKEGSQKSLKSHSKHKKQRRDHKKFHKDFQAYQNGVKKNQINLLEPEKKYFDYFPLEDVNMNFKPLKDDDVEVVLLSNNTLIKERVLKSTKESQREPKIKRSKRGVAYPANYIRPNQNIVPNFLASERNDQQVDEVQASNIIPQVQQYYSQGTHNDPWNNPYSRPQAYLPVPRPFVPHIKYPIAGIYYNPVSPSGNRPVLTPSGGTSIGSRFGEEDRVIWEINYVGGARRPVAAAPPSSFNDFTGSGISGGSFIPTTRRPATSTSMRPEFSTTRAPVVSPTKSTSPPLIHTDNRNRKTTVQPPRRTPSNVTPQASLRPRPIQRTTTSRPNSLEPSKCVWAIVSCCSRNDLNIRYSCFEQIGCHGAFWDLNPCADNLQDAALRESEIYFQR